MNKLKKTNKILKILIMASMLTLTLSLSYSYFTANISRTETNTTITANGGVMNIVYNGINNPNYNLGDYLSPDYVEQI